MLPLRILVTLLILTMLLPGWGLLDVSHAHKERPAISVEEVSALAPFGH